jgi:hypothetical protein
MKDFFAIYYYFILIDLIALIGSISYFLLPIKAKMNRLNLLLFSNIFLLFFYENLAMIFSFKNINNHLIYNVFSSHFGTILTLLLISFYIKDFQRKDYIKVILLGFLISSAVLHLIGLIAIDDSGEVISLLSSIAILFACMIFFLELITNDSYLEINLLRYAGFWIVSSFFFYFSSSFMINISFEYLYKNHMNVYLIVSHIQRFMAIGTAISILLALISKVSLEKYQKAFLHE